MAWGEVPLLTDADSPTKVVYEDSFIAIETEPAPVAGGTSPLDLLHVAYTGKCAPRVRGHMRQKFPGGPQQVRRPAVGLSLKAERHAFLQVYRSDGTVVPLYNQVGGWYAPADKQDAFPGETELHKSAHYTDFMVTSVQEQRAEKIQVVETFGEDYLYATGSRPQIISVVGYLCNSVDFPWRAEFWSNYNRYFRGTKLLENRYSAYFGWDDILVEGYLLSAGASESADNQDIVHFNFNFLVTDYISLAEMNFESILANLEKSSAAPAFWEMTQRGEPLIYSDNAAILTSEGMRARQRFIQLSNLPAIGPFAELLKVNPALIEQIVGDPTSYLKELGTRATGALAAKGKDLIFEELGGAYDQAMYLKDQSCSKTDLTGRMLYEEGWKTATGWIRKILTILERVGTPVPAAWPTMWWDLKYLLNNPLNFLEVFLKRSNKGDKGFAVIGAIAAATMAGAFVYDFADSFSPAGSTLSTTGKAYSDTAKSAFF